MFSENLKAMRKAKGYTQEELAIKLAIKLAVNVVPNKNHIFFTP